MSCGPSASQNGQRWQWVLAFARTTAEFATTAEIRNYAAAILRKPFHIAVAAPEVSTGRIRVSW
ncbi:hypothetical protein ABIB85_003227 [Bradyrhizobium sp. JR1.5]